MTRLWDRLSPAKSPDPDSIRVLDESRRSLEEAEDRDAVVTKTANFMVRRQAKNHFGEDLDITYLRRRNA